MKPITLLLCLFFIQNFAQANSPTPEESSYLIKVSPQLKARLAELKAQLPQKSDVKDLNFNNWIQIQVPPNKLKSLNLAQLKNQPGILKIQPNFKISLPQDYSHLKSQLTPEQLTDIQNKAKQQADIPDNLPIPESGSGGQGADPEFNKQWGMLDIGVQNGWKHTKGSEQVVVAVIDTGVDYTHEDLVDNLWRNPGEQGLDKNGRNKATNGIDDDQNGFVDDTIGWDFVSNDAKPYDLTLSIWDILMGGGNPGHGTHCAGNVAARSDNGKGVAGVAPKVKIMGLRFLSEKGQGTTEGAIQAIKYAVDNGAKVLSNSWGSEGESSDGQENTALKEAILYAESHGALFVAAAGNGHNGIGYDNDTDPRPGVPASYNMESIISVAALDVNNQLGSFSNWGRSTVDIGAPGVKVFSTIVGSKYSDKVVDYLGIKVTWDGTSMATPHVAGAAALYWSQYPNKTWQQVKQALLTTATPVASMKGKSTSEGKLDVSALMRK